MRIFLIAALLAATPALASDLTLTHATVYTVPGAAPVPNATIRIHDGKILSIRASASSNTPSATTIDCTGLTVTAGFWNSHVHILPAELLHVEQQPAAVVDAQLRTMFTQWGFTSVFDLASVLSNTNLLRHKIEAGALVGPRILTVGEPFWSDVPSYVQQYLTQNHIDIPATTSPAQAVTRVDREVHDGADGIKIFAGAIEPDRVELLPSDIAIAVVREAHRHHRLVFSHPSSVKGVELSLDSGADILAHVSAFEGPWPPALVQRMLAAHMSVIPTLTLFDVESQKGHASPEDTRKLIDLAVSQLHAYNAVGGQILFGTDIGYTDHYDTAEEFTLMAQAGMTFAQILASLTTTPAQRFGYGAHSGRVAPGYDADLVVLRSDPAADITALSRIAYTIRAGQVLYTAP